MLWSFGLFILLDARLAREEDFGQHSSLLEDEQKNEVEPLTLTLAAFNSFNTVKSVYDIVQAVRFRSTKFAGLVELAQSHIVAVQEENPTKSGVLLLESYQKLIKQSEEACEQDLPMWITKTIGLVDEEKELQGAIKIIHEERIIISTAIEAIYQDFMCPDLAKIAHQKLQAAGAAATAWEQENSRSYYKKIAEETEMPGVDLYQALDTGVLLTGTYVEHMDKKCYRFNDPFSAEVRDQKLAAAAAAVEAAELDETPEQNAVRVAAETAEAAKAKAEADKEAVDLKFKEVTKKFHEAMFDYHELVSKCASTKLCGGAEKCEDAEIAQCFPQTRDTYYDHLQTNEPFSQFALWLESKAGYIDSYGDASALYTIANSPMDNSGWFASAAWIGYKATQKLPVKEECMKAAKLILEQQIAADQLAKVNKEGHQVKDDGVQEAQWQVHHANVVRTLQVKGAGLHMLNSLIGH